MVDDNEIIKKIFKIAKNQQKILNKLAQNTGSSDNELLAKAANEIQRALRASWDDFHKENLISVVIVERNKIYQVEINAPITNSSQKSIIKTHVNTIMQKYNLTNYQIFVNNEQIH